MQEITTVAETERIGARDLRSEAATALAIGSEQRVYYLRDTLRGANVVEVVYFPAAGRGGVAWGATANWTNADSAEDALARYFGEGGLKMVE